MNTNQVKGKAKEVAGKIQKNVGNAIGSKSQEAKGQTREMSGKIQKKTGDVQKSAKEAQATKH